MTADFNVSNPQLGHGEKCEKILRKLPEWFGIEDAVVKYGKEIDILPTFLIRKNQALIGFITIKEHFATAAELFVLGILPEFHNQGIGQSSIHKVEQYCREKGICFLQVKTLGPNRECAAYEKTRRFYLKMGFHPLEEFSELWGPSNPCLLMVKKVPKR